MPPSLSFTAPTPEASPISPVQNERHQKLSTDPLVSVLRVPSTPPVARTTSSSSHKGKRKADEAGVGGGATPPKEHKEPRATFAVGPRRKLFFFLHLYSIHFTAGVAHRESGTSGSSRAPSSYHRKRARLSTTPESRPASRTSGDNQTAATTGSWSSRGSGYPAPHRPPPTVHQEQLHRTPSRRSLSQTSIPISALISPHAPSISRSATFHMRDPRKPAPVQSTPWSLAFPSSGDGPWVERGGSPLHAWLFFIGFITFPIWWIAAFVGIPRTRRLGGTDVEKSVLLDDPQVEFVKDANSWRKRCRVMAAVSFLTYVPFVVLVAIFAR
ncbi:hypothetical protein BDZ94DRAFT_1216909 [Collybia nuda]|uniref:Uncharacterized protein n=1 Tax=Collybia nuda TaxID=64659 RepID=A0A9P5Y6B9_9AGAR|nr:hypothetical protein BDZ94DRAFT_1216909 [Collybia nuda]